MDLGLLASRARRRAPSLPWACSPRGRTRLPWGADQDLRDVVRAGRVAVLRAFGFGVSDAVHGRVNDDLVFAPGLALRIEPPAATSMSRFAFEGVDARRVVREGRESRKRAGEALPSRFNFCLQVYNTKTPRASYSPVKPAWIPVLVVPALKNDIASILQ